MKNMSIFMKLHKVAISHCQISHIRLIEHPRTKIRTFLESLYMIFYKCLKITLGVSSIFSKLLVVL